MEDVKHAGWPLTQQLLWGVTILAGSVLWTWVYNNTGSVLAVAVFHAGMNSIGIFHPADRTALVPGPGGILDPWLLILAEGSSAIVLVGVALLVVRAFGPERLSVDAIPDGESPGFGDTTTQ